VNSSERRKTKVETPSIASKSRRTQRRAVEAAMPQGHPCRVNTANLPRRRFLHLAAGAAALPAVSCDPEAQSYPSRPITMIVPFPPGGNTDVVGRTLAERMGKSLGQPVIIENVSGADGSIGTLRAVRARSDGYTIDLGSTTTHVMIGAVYSLSYDVLNDFAPISPVTMDWRILFASKTVPAKDLKELIAWLKGNPNKASMGLTSVENHLVSALFQKQTGAQFAFVPYRGQAADRAGGRPPLK
jgi:tripartite-type tricarboxylate transporter receptor subunit TctC